MNVKEQIKETVDYLAACGLIAAGIAGTYAVVLGIALGLNAGVEVVQRKLFNESRQTYRATLEDLGESQLMQTKGYLRYGDFKLEDGNNLRVHDSIRVLEGKLSINSEMPGRQSLGKEYDLTVFGSEKTGYSLLKSEEVEK